MKLRFKFWVEEGETTVFGEGTRRILENINLYGSISRTAVEMNMSYRQAWGHIRKVEERLDVKLVFTQKGGRGGGGGTKLTSEGENLVLQLKEFKQRGQYALEEIFEEVFKQ